jgi:hypothetical protein
VCTEHKWLRIGDSIELKNTIRKEPSVTHKAKGFLAQLSDHSVFEDDFNPLRPSGNYMNHQL